MHVERSRIISFLNVAENITIFFCFISIYTFDFANSVKRLQAKDN